MFLLISKEILNYCGLKGRNWIITLSDGTIHFKNPNEQSESKIEKPGPDGEAGEEEKSDEKSENLNFKNTPSYIALEKAKVTPTMFSKYMGRFIGKAIFDRQLINIPLSKQLRLAMLGKETEIETETEIELEVESDTNVSADRKDGNDKEENIHKDSKSDAIHLQLNKLKEIDSDTYNSLTWMLTNDITDILFETFTVLINGKETPLCKNGDNIDVTNTNKLEYISLFIDYKTKYSIATLLQPFLEGFHEIVPLKVLHNCELTTIELDLILNGKPTIDIDEIRGYCMFQGARVFGIENDDGDGYGSECKFGEDSEVVQWLWAILRSFETEQCRSYLHFVTGTSRVPLDGYDPPFNITDGMDMESDSLPKAHTCFNQIVLPRYSSYDCMREKLLYAIENTEGFQLS